MTCLVLTNTTDDAHTLAVVEAITDIGGDPFRLDIDRLSRGDASVEVQISPAGFSAELSQDGQCYTSDQITSIWYRRPNTFDFPIKDPGQRDFAEKELRNVLEGLWLCLEDARWLNKPWDMVRANHKMYQLKFAYEFGMALPHTLVTNRPDAVRKMSDEYPNIIYKTLSQQTMEKAGAMLNMATTIMTASHLASIDLIRITPSLFQPYLQKSYEVRVTAVAGKLFAAKLWNPAGQQDVVDWRPPDEFRNIKHEAIELPTNVNDFCQAMMRHFRLRYATFDFVVGEGDVYTFLELNLNGQWLWIEKLLGYSISEEIARTLVRGERR